jgi:dihydrodipicolinate synthase/N-acetylneuraminate lyase
VFEEDVIAGTLAAAVTPLRDGELDVDALGPYTDFLAAGGLDGILALGTTGEGILFSTDERRRAVEGFVAAAGGRLRVVAHCGAQTTRDTVTLAAHAAEAGAVAVAVIGPPYFQLDQDALVAHFAATARACAPLPFYLYEFEKTSGYPIPLPAIERLRELAPNLAGLKVSDTPWESFRPYLVEGLDVLVGPEALIHQGLAGGAVGAVSGLASAFPELVAEAVRDRGAEASARAGEVRAAIEGFPRHAALKHTLARRGVPVGPEVRAPLRGLTEEERKELDRVLADVLALA